MRRRRHDIASGRTWRLGIEFVPQDAWIGVYWRRYRFVPIFPAAPRIDLYVCVIPFVSIHLRWWYASAPSVLTEADMAAARDLAAEWGLCDTIGMAPIPDIARGG